VSEPTSPTCLNCGEGLADLPRARRFCPACGQETNVKPPKLSEFLQQFGGAYFSTEGALWRTLKLLLTKPGELTRLYLAGVRKHYVLPLRLYLTISVLVLLALRVVGENGGVVHVKSTSPEEQAQMARENRNFSIALGRGQAGMRNGQFFCENMPEWMCKRFKRRIDISPQQTQDMVRDLATRFMGNLGSAMFVLLPSFALWLKLAYRSRRMRYTEHLVFALHVHAFWFLCFALMLPDTPWLSGPAFFAVPIYTMLALKRVYGGRWWPRLLRAGFVALMYLIVMAFTLSIVGLWTILS
jgi:hypothetical protein